MKTTILFAVFIGLTTAAAVAQEDTEDTLASVSNEYYNAYPDLLTTRFYFSQKYAAPSIHAKNGKKDLNYRPNSTLKMGLGATYGWFTLNLSYGWEFLNKGEEAEKGKSKWLDLQVHMYRRKMSIDLLGEFYRGFYLPSDNIAGNTPGVRYIRPDIKVGHVGAAVYHVLNGDRFSYRAALLQNEWQKKSAGSLLLGAEAYYGELRGDSSLVPAALKNDYEQQGISRVRYATIGPGAGYAYTLVIARHFYLMGSATGMLSLDMAQESTGSIRSETKFSFHPDLFYRAAIGYNSSRFNIGTHWVNNDFQTAGVAGRYRLNTGNVRLYVTYRFIPGERLKKQLRFFERKNKSK